MVEPVIGADDHWALTPDDHALIQNCMVYINTLMIQKVLAQPHWHGRLTPRDYAALTPLNMGAREPVWTVRP